MAGFSGNLRVASAGFGESGHIFSALPILVNWQRWRANPRVNAVRS